MSFTFQNIIIPPLYCSIQTGSDDPRILEWKSNAHSTLSELKVWVAKTDVASLEHEDLASIAAIAVSLNNESDLFYQRIARRGLIGATRTDIMAQLPSPTLEVITCVLSKHVKPCFSKTPHSLLNPSTGRKRSRPAGGPSAILDFYENQEWKAYPGIAALLLWCLNCTEGREYEYIWHLVIPPIMTLLDDYESYYKLDGVKVVCELLNHAPPELLKRTGVDGLLMTSLKTALLHLHSPLTPQIILAAVPAHLQLINLTTASGSKVRFDQLCTLLGEGIIGGIWMYAYQEWETLEASMVAARDVVRNLGVGTTRYLKALVSQLMLNIASLSQQHQLSMQLASLGLLEVIICVCKSRIDNWTGLILGGVARLWVNLEDSDFVNKQDVQRAIQKVTYVLGEACPSVVLNEYDRLLTCDSSMFQGLLVTELVAN
ncbi:hypothetical protein BU17DRAFT_80296 [Hysterangium stoloniferum]|nr:hypothetical protein BU17DRAFT_80296 [Hysterangium stoloniferum]